MYNQRAYSKKAIIHRTSVDFDPEAMDNERLRTEPVNNTQASHGKLRTGVRQMSQASSSMEHLPMMNPPVRTAYRDKKKVKAANMKQSLSSGQFSKNVTDELLRSSVSKLNHENKLSYIPAAATLNAKTSFDISHQRSCAQVNGQ